ncbi:hypothetical protein DBR40_09005 [Pedobacter sp. KBW01]|uniref:helix-turn-helix domain-containing protein n=1 Tax=Pedobacter sp. KBW01 TaxID=2153364 RepID=UPI000F5A6E66|nr:helix-turn-helix transcriptional regulator [Pedobacter sp. KBW01]RQO78077.1 hypothetical protein DBR40_09005 [Pedobacter sp. KBW01]
MEQTKPKVDYPENLYLREAVKQSGISITHLAKKLGFSRKVVSDTVNGKYKGSNIIPSLKELLNLKGE